MGQLEPDKFERGTKLALDTVTFIYFLEQHPIHFATVKELFCLIETAELTAVMSSLIFAELLVPAYRADDIKRVQTLVRLLTNFPNIQIIPLSPEISAEAARLRAVHNMRTPDAVHAATALKVSADAIITNDKGFLRLSENIDIWLFDAAPTNPS